MHQSLASDIVKELIRNRIRTNGNILRIPNVSIIRAPIIGETAPHIPGTNMKIE
jgi:hypothetical protein